jgi:hypothetical protein
MTKIKKYELFCEGADDKQLDWILDKISKYGRDSLSKAERDYIDGKETPNQPDPHYNRYILKLLLDLKNKDITEEIAKQFIQKFTTKEDLFDTLLQLLRDGKLDTLLNFEKIKDNE